MAIVDAHSTHSDLDFLLKIQIYTANQNLPLSFWKPSIKNNFIIIEKL